VVLSIGKEQKHNERCSFLSSAPEHLIAADRK
jgi:hypothetical protein